METKFTKLDKDFPGRWSMFFHSGTDWLLLFELLEDEHKKPQTFFFGFILMYFIFH